MRNTLGLTPEQLRGIPVRNGETYCSPKCGFNCSLDAYLQAAEEAEAVIRLLPAGWKAHLWDNAGWHYELVYDLLSVKPIREKEGRGCSTNGAMTGGWDVTGWEGQFWPAPHLPQYRAKASGITSVVKVLMEKAEEDAHQLSTAIGEYMDCTKRFDE